MTASSSRSTRLGADPAVLQEEKDFAGIETRLHSGCTGRVTWGFR